MNSFVDISVERGGDSEGSCGCDCEKVEADGTGEGTGEDEGAGEGAGEGYGKKAEIDGTGEDTDESLRRRR